MIKNRINPYTSGSKQDQHQIRDIRDNTSEVICRIFFVRHGVSIDEVKRGKDSKQPRDSNLHDIGKAQMEEVATILKGMGCKKNDTLILYSPGKNTEEPIHRVIESAQILERNGVWTIKEHNALDTPEKVVLPDGNIVIKDGRLFTRVEQFYQILQLTNNEILKSFSWENDLAYNKYKNIILLWHKSNAWVSEVVRKEWDGIELCKTKIGNWDIWQFDINNRYEFINYEEDMQTLHPNYQNIDSIFTLLNQEKWLEKDITAHKEKEVNIFEIQNIINAYFVQHPELYEKYIISENKDIRVFCLANLLMDCNKLYRDKPSQVRLYDILFKEFGLCSREDRRNFYRNSIDPNVKRFFFLKDTEYTQTKFKLSREEKKLLLSNRPMTDELIINLFVQKRDLRNGEEWDLFHTYESDAFYKELKERRSTYEKAMGIQKRSLDIQIKKQEKWWVLKRQIYKIEKPGTATQEEDYRETRIDITTIIEWPKHRERYILPAHVGNGKSIWLSELVKDICTREDINIKFFEGSHFDSKEKINDINMPTIIEWKIDFYDPDEKIGIVKSDKGDIWFKWENDFDKEFPLDTNIEAIIVWYEKDGEWRWRIERIQRYQDYQEDVIHADKQREWPVTKEETQSLRTLDEYKYLDRKNILCIDGIDEIKKSEIKEDIKYYIERSLPYTVIATSRLSEYHDKKNDNFTTLKMDPVKKEEFISSRIHDPNKIKALLNKLEESNLVAEIEGNPLLLSFICALADEDWKRKEIGIKNLNQIQNKWELYENVTKLILYEHQTAKWSDTYRGDINDIDEEIKRNMKILGKFAYFLFKNQKAGKGNIPFTQFKEDNDISSTTLNQLSILFKKTESGNYGFIHQSFEEFFLARHLAETNNGWKELFDREGSTGKDRSKQKGIKPVIEMHSELLINQEKIDDLYSFLWEDWLLKDDDPLGYNFYVWLDILNEIEENKENKVIFDAYEKKLNEMNEIYPNNQYLFAYHFTQKQRTNDWIERHIDIGALFDIFKERLMRWGNYRDDGHPKSIKNKKRIPFLYNHHKEFLDKKEILDKIKWEAGIYEILAEKWYKEALHIIHKLVEQFSNKKIYGESGFTIVKRAKKAEKETLNLIYKYIEDIFKDWWYYTGFQICRYLEQIGESKATKIINKYTKILSKKWISRDMKDGDYEGPSTEQDYRKTQESEHQYPRPNINTNDTKKVYQEAIKLGYTYANWLYNKGIYEWAAAVYAILAQNDSKESIQSTIDCADRLSANGRYKKALRIRLEISDIEDKKGNSEQKWSTLFVTLKNISDELTNKTTNQYLQKEMQSRYLYAEELFDKEEYEKAAKIGVSLARFGHKEAMKLVAECIRELSKKRRNQYAIIAYNQLMCKDQSQDRKMMNSLIDKFKRQQEQKKSGKLEWTQAKFPNINTTKSIDAMNEYAENVLTERSWENIAANICCDLVTLDPNKAMQLARRLEDMTNNEWKNSNQKMLELWRRLAKTHNKEAIDFAYGLAKKLHNNQDHQRTLYICKQIIREVDSEKARELSYQSAKSIIRKNENPWRWIMSQFIEKGYKGSIPLAYNLARVLYTKKEYHEAGYLYVDLAGIDPKYQATALKLSYSCANQLVNQWKYKDAASVYTDLIKRAWEKSAEELIYKCAEKAWDKKKYEEAGNIYTNIIYNIDNIGERAIEWAYVCAQKLYDSWKYKDAARIYRGLQERWVIRHREQIYKCWEMLLSKWKYEEALWLYQELVKKGEEEAIKLAQECIGKVNPREAIRAYQEMAWNIN